MAVAVVRTNAAQIARKYERRITLLRAELGAVEEKQARAALALAQKYSSASIPLGKSHPYSRRRPHPPMPAYWISRRSGGFFSGWRISRQNSGAVLRYSLSNVSRVSRYMSGTSRMIERPILQQVLREIRKPRLDAEVAAVRKAMRAE